MAMTKELKTAKGILQITIKFLQMVESGQKKLITMKATNEEHNFFHQVDVRIPWDEDEPSKEVTHGFERKVEAMFNHVPLKDRGYSGKL